MYDPGSKETHHLDLTHAGRELIRVIYDEVSKRKITFSNQKR